MFKLKSRSYNLKAISGFTLIELLIVIAIIAILAGVVFVSLNPLKRFQDARNASRWTDTTAILSAIKVDQVDNGGSYFTALNAAPPTIYPARNYMIGTAVTGCSQSAGVPLASCPSGATTTDSCINLQELSDQGYLAKIPVSPNGTGTWDATLSGYYLSKNANGSVTVGACDAEGGGTITVNR